MPDGDPGYEVTPDFERFAQKDDVFRRSFWDERIRSKKSERFYRTYRETLENWRSADGFTHIAGAISFSSQLLQGTQFTSARHVIDISGDGTNNVRPHPPMARDAAVQAGITINGLTIINEAKDLDVYYRNTVIGGPGAFVIVAQDYEDYARAMVRKLVREINARFLS